uniref:Peroxin-14 n=1 Tax=Macrostomum lignano TaxID=282301 RepID=A0A1I8H408_9PLAT
MQQQQQQQQTSTPSGVSGMTEDAALNAVASLLKDMIKGNATVSSSAADSEVSDRAAADAADLFELSEFRRPPPPASAAKNPSPFSQHQQLHTAQSASAGSSMTGTGPEVTAAPAAYRPSLQPPTAESAQSPRSQPASPPPPPPPQPQPQQQQQQKPPSLLSRQFSRPYKWKLVPIDALK